MYGFFVKWLLAKDKAVLQAVPTLELCGIGYGEGEAVDEAGSGGFFVVGGRKNGGFEGLFVLVVSEFFDGAEDGDADGLVAKVQEVFLKIGLVSGLFELGVEAHHALDGHGFG